MNWICQNNFKFVREIRYISTIFQSNENAIAVDQEIGKGFMKETVLTFGLKDRW